MSEQDNLTIIQQELSTYGGKQKVAGSWHMVQCAFHQDNTPSMGVYLAYDGRYPLGHCHCLGCGANKSWNQFAKEANLQVIDEWKNKEEYVDDNFVKKAEEELLGKTNTLNHFKKLLKVPEAQPWPETFKWRGFSGTLLRKLGCLICNDNYNESVACILPVSIFGKVRGAVKAVYERKEKQLGYISAPGEWVKTYGLLPFDPVLKSIRYHKIPYVFLVEGPRDALRLISLKIPALAVLGTQNISKKKIELVKSMGVSVIYVMTDNDVAGTAMWRKIKTFAEGIIEVRRFKLPTEFDENNNLIKIDPCSMSDDITKELIRILRKRHGYPVKAK